MEPWGWGGWGAGVGGPWRGSTEEPWAPGVGRQRHEEAANRKGEDAEATGARKGRWRGACGGEP